MSGENKNASNTISISFGARGYASSTATDVKFGANFSITQDTATAYARLATNETIGSMSGNWSIVANGNAYFEGTIYATGDIAGYQSSDKRLKKNIKPISHPIDKIKKITGYTFTWRESYYKDKSPDFIKKNDVGVIAQEVQEILPEVVHTRKNGVLAVDYSKIVPLLIEAIKEQQIQIEELRNAIANLR
jgi:hypothetical protein